MIKIYNIYRDKRNTDDCMPTLAAFVGYNKKELKELVPKKYRPTLYDLTEHTKSKNYMLTYLPRIKHYCLDTAENFAEEYPYTKWMHIGNVK